MVAGDWQNINIGRDTTLKARIGWQGLTVKEYRDNGEYYLVTGTDFERGLVNWNTCHYVDKYRYTQDKNIQLKNGDILITKDGTIGKVGYVENLTLPATLNSGVFVVRPKSRSYDTKYLYYIFTSSIFDDFLTKLVAGSTINHLYQKDFVNFEFKVPNIQQQQAIATALSDTDELVNSLEKLIAKKEAIKTGAMQELLTGKKRLDGFSGEWEEKKLGDLSEMFSGGTPSSKIIAYYNGKIRWVSISDMTIAGKFLFDTEKKITQKGLDNSSARIFPENTLLLAMYASIGKCCIAINEVATSQAILGISPKSKILKEYLYYYFVYNRAILINQGQQGTQSNLNKEMVQSIIISLPSMAEQQEITTILSDMDSAIEALKTKLSKVKAIKEGMMQELLTGRTRLIEGDKDGNS